MRLSSGMVVEYSAAVARDVVMRDLLLTGSYEPIQTEMIERLLPTGGVFVDVGANVGYFSILGARRVGPTGRVYAFEPAEEIYQLLLRNVSLNGLTNIEALQLACFSSPGQMALERASDSGKSYLISQGIQKASPVELTTVDAFVTQARIERVDLIKIDAEGSDWEVLRGASWTVERFRPSIILELDHLARFGGSRFAVLDFLSRYGYEVSQLTGKHSVDLVARQIGR